MLHLGSVALDGTPRVVIAVRDGVPRDSVEAAIAAGADIVELRIDQFSSVAEEDVLRHLARYAGIPKLATIRAAWEGGAWHGSERERAALFRAVLPHVDAVDIELSSGEIREEVVESAHTAGKLVLGSYHHFEAVPSVEALEAIVADAAGTGVDLLKVAAYCGTRDELRRLAAFTLSQAGRGVVTVGMGPAGQVSRVFFPALGSLLTYTFLGAPTAPGQLNWEDTLEYLKAFYPGCDG